MIEIIPNWHPVFVHFPIAFATTAVLFVVLGILFKAKREASSEPFSVADLHEAVTQGALLRVRPIMMTVCAITAGLLPIMWGSGTGSEVMRRIAAPMVGGMISVTFLSLIVIPVLYALVKAREIKHSSSGESKK